MVVDEVEVPVVALRNGMDAFPMMFLLVIGITGSFGLMVEAHGIFVWT